MVAFLDRVPATFDGLDEAGWPAADPATETQLAILYGKLVEQRAERERRVAQEEAPPRPLTVYGGIIVRSEDANPTAITAV